MTSIKVKFRPSANADSEGVIYYQIIHERTIRQILSPHRIFSSEWNAGRSSVGNSRDSVREYYLIEIRRHIYLDIARLQRIINQYERRGMTFTADQLVAEYFRRLNRCSLSRFMKSLIADFRKSGQLRTAETYTSALHSVQNFLRSYRSNPDILLDAIDGSLMEEYQNWHKLRGNMPNTISFYSRILRAVYNRAVEEDLIPNLHPFRHVYTGVAKTHKRAISIAAIKEIRHLDLSGQPQLDHARDMFIMSFMLRGMSFIDMAMLKKSDLADGRISYVRRKTRQRLSIEWTEEMQRILNKYPNNPTDYLLPIIRRMSVNERSVVHNLNHSINQRLKRIAEMAGIEIPLTLYVARHSWASAALTKGIPIGVISEGMGHSSEQTTRIYLANLDTSPVDRANALLLRCLE